MDCSLPGSSVHGILAGILEWVAISSLAKEAHTLSQRLLQDVLSEPPTWKLHFSLRHRTLCEPGTL